MSTITKRRIEALERAHADRLPLLPGLVVVPGEDLDERRRAFIAEHGRPPEVELVIKVSDARRHRDEN